MHKRQLEAAVAIARSAADLLGEDIDVFHGYGLHGFKPVTCTLRQVAALIRWQCVYLNGNLDGAALDELADLGKTRFIVLDNPIESLTQLLACAAA